MEKREFPTNNGDGWILDVRRFYDPARFDPSLRPVLFIPGYCMNTFVLGFHPEGMSMVEYLVSRRFEVWTANLRGQGDSCSSGGTRNFGFRETALVDLPHVIERVRSSTKAEDNAVDIIGCSLGGTFVFAYLAYHPQDHGIGSIVGIGAPLRWTKVHPALKVLFGSPRLAGALPIYGTRRFARIALPVVKHIPKVLSLYMNAKIIDLSAADDLVKTVDDPVRQLNREIAQWVKDVDLTLDGVNVTDAMRRIDRPLLCILANADGIVPQEAARSIVDAIGTDDAEVLVAGEDNETWFAHADLFISHYAQERVFEPLANWLEKKKRA